MTLSRTKSLLILAVASVLIASSGWKTIAGHRLSHELRLQGTEQNNEKIPVFLEKMNILYHTTKVVF